MTSPRNSSHFNQGFITGIAASVIFAVVFIATSITLAHDDDDETDDSDQYESVSRWTFECHDRVNGCSEGGLFYHTQKGPDGNAWYIAHYSETGNVYARRVRFPD